GATLCGGGPPRRVRLQRRRRAPRVRLQPGAPGHRLHRRAAVARHRCADPRRQPRQRAAPGLGGGLAGDGGAEGGRCLRCDRAGRQRAGRGTGGAATLSARLRDAGRPLHAAGTARRPRPARAGTAAQRGDPVGRPVQLRPAQRRTRPRRHLQLRPGRRRHPAACAAPVRRLRGVRGGYRRGGVAVSAGTSGGDHGGGRHADGGRGAIGRRAPAGGDRTGTVAAPARWRPARRGPAHAM
ncbi:hypothetical protein XPN_0733, partial [Xanthomonas arboricola pv. pruni MAFF 301427]